MSEAAVKQFCTKVDGDMNLRDQLRAAKQPVRSQTLAAIVAIGATQGFAFTAAEYESVVDSELKAVFANHRSVFHHHLINMG